jgi:hypothetical protein
MRLEVWEGRYWHAAQIILNVLNSSLEEWLGAAQARAPKELVEEVANATVEAAKGRVEQAKEHFAKRPKKERMKAIEESKAKHSYHYPNLFNLSSDSEWEVECPACAGRAFLAGVRYGEQILDTASDEEEEVVATLYSAEELRCPVCDLHLDSREEIEAVGLEADHEEIESRERQYGPEYGNC